jgi:nitroimidazol reductase NimA-like FMN-containing flavoprotein (pyridoxamine 5'-phosphate oxidase superfamily)
VTHESRIKRQLVESGVSRYALWRAEARALPASIHKDEQIMAAVYGRTSDGSAMLIATDRRILYFDKKPFITISDEISYEVVSGVGLTQENGIRAGITVFTRMGNYTIKMANPRSVNRFKKYLEESRLEGAPQPDSRRTHPIDRNITKKPSKVALSLDDKAIDFISTHELGVLSTADKSGEPHGATVYYYFEQENKVIYILTKSETQKAHNLIANPRVALTIYDENKLQTAQLSGRAQIETDLEVKKNVFEKINHTRKYGEALHHPPVTKLTEGNFITFKISIDSGTYHDFMYSR